MLITAGPTREYLDPIRYLSNASSGMMGFTLAKTARNLGAKVMVVSGPSRISAPWGVRTIPVISAEQMYRETLKLFSQVDIVIGAAAVSDWKFAKASNQKFKKTGHSLEITLLPNPDILAELGRRKREQKNKKRKILVGFALETHQWLTHAKEKLLKKNLDIIIANKPENVGMSNARIAILDRKGHQKIYPPISKQKAAEVILKSIEPLLNAPFPT
ncbi:MAG: phosphopantothenoylcysteine decarboxylase [Elusimicrobia bacterium]|nr:phosphopantothenoylcysteine decarboxylase [Elusimicrobiota bacterium]